MSHGLDPQFVPAASWLEETVTTAGLVIDRLKLPASPTMDAQIYLARNGWVFDETNPTQWRKEYPPATRVVYIPAVEEKEESETLAQWVKDYLGDAQAVPLPTTAMGKALRKYKIIPRPGDEVRVDNSKGKAKTHPSQGTYEKLLGAFKDKSGDTHIVTEFPDGSYHARLDSWWSDTVSSGEFLTERTSYKKFQRNPELYHRLVGKCPPGWYYDSKLKRCVNAKLARAAHTAVPSVHAEQPKPATTVGTPVKSGRVSGLFKAAGHKAWHAISEPVKQIYGLTTSSKVRKEWKNWIVDGVKTETRETKELLGTVGKLLTKQPISQKEKEAAIHQTADLLKAALLAGILVAPGASSLLHGHIAAGLGELFGPVDDLAVAPLDAILRFTTGKVFGKKWEHGAIPTGFKKTESLFESPDPKAALLQIMREIIDQLPVQLSDQDVADILDKKLSPEKARKFLASLSKVKQESLADKFVRRLDEDEDEPWNLTREEYFNRPELVLKHVGKQKRLAAFRYGKGHKASVEVGPDAKKGDAVTAGVVGGVITNIRSVPEKLDNMQLYLRGKVHHKEAVAAALKAGKKIRPEVLADYPDLKESEYKKKGAYDASEGGDVHLISELALSSQVPVTKKFRRFHGNYAGRGNRGGKPIDALDYAAYRHDIGYHHTANPLHRFKHDATFIKRADAVVKDRGNRWPLRTKAKLASTFFKLKHLLQRRKLKKLWNKDFYRRRLREDDKGYDADTVNKQAAAQLFKFINGTAQYVSSVARPVALYKKKGEYDKSKSHLLAQHVVPAGAKAWWSRNGDKGKPYYHTFNPPTRELVMKLLAKQAEKDAAKSKYDEVLPLRYQADFKGYDKAQESTRQGVYRLFEAQDRGTGAKRLRIAPIGLFEDDRSDVSDTEIQTFVDLQIVRGKDNDAIEQMIEDKFGKVGVHLNALGRVVADEQAPPKQAKAAPKQAPATAEV